MVNNFNTFRLTWNCYWSVSKWTIDSITVILELKSIRETRETSLNPSQVKYLEDLDFARP